jgi:hypothetical protein
VGENEGKGLRGKRRREGGEVEEEIWRSERRLGGRITVGGVARISRGGCASIKSKSS